MGFDLGSLANSAFTWGTQMIGANEEQHRLSDAAGRQQDFQERMRATQYQTSVADMRAAGLNPAMMYDRGGPGAGTLSGANAGAPRSSQGVDFAAQASATAAARSMDADAELKKAQAAEVTARTATYPVQIDKVRQDIAESQEKIRNLIANSSAQYASAAQARQSVENMRAAIPQIEATIGQLRSLSKLNDAQVREVASRMRLQESQVREIVQKVSANLPQAERAFVEAKTKLKELEAPKAEMEAAPYTHGHPASAIGALSTVLRALNPLAGLIQIAK